MRNFVLVALDLSTHKYPLLFEKGPNSDTYLRNAYPPTSDIILREDIAANATVFDNPTYLQEESYSLVKVLIHSAYI